MPVRRKSKPSAKTPETAKPPVAKAAPKKKKQSMADVMEEARGGRGRGSVY